MGLGFLKDEFLLWFDIWIGGGRKCKESGGVGYRFR